MQSHPLNLRLPTGSAGVCVSALQLDGDARGSGSGVSSKGLRRDHCSLAVWLGRLGLGTTWVVDLLWDPAGSLPYW